MSAGELRKDTAQLFSSLLSSPVYSLLASFREAPDPLLDEEPLSSPQPPEAQSHGQSTAHNAQTARRSAR